MLIFNYKEEYGVNFKVTPYELKAYTQDEAMKMLKWERRIEFGMESSRFFDLVRWGEAKDVINAYYVTEAARCSIYKNAGFTENKNEYLPFHSNRSVPVTEIIHRISLVIINLKTKNKMKSIIKQLYTILLVTVACLTVAGCSDDFKSNLSSGRRCMGGTLSNWMNTQERSITRIRQS